MQPTNLQHNTPHSQHHLSAMAENVPLPDGADIQAIRQAYLILQTEVPRLGNRHIDQQNQHIIDQLHEIRETLQTHTTLLHTHTTLLESHTALLQTHSTLLESHTTLLHDIQARQTATENTVIRIQNVHRVATTSPLLPLKNPLTGQLIPNCPSTLSEIYRLTRARATSLLEQLQVPVIPHSLQDKRDAVRGHFVL